MSESKLFDLLRTFDKEDWKEFENFLKGHTSAESELYTTYHFIASYKNNLNSNRIKTDVIIEKLFPQKPRKNFQNLLSRLHHEVQEYMSWHQVQSDAIIKNMQLLKAYQSRGLYLLADKLAEEIVKSIENSPLGLADTQNLFNVFHELYFSENPIKNRKEGKDILSSSIKAFKSHYAEMCVLYAFEVENRVLNGASEYSTLRGRDMGLISSEPSPLSDYLKLLRKMRIEYDADSFEKIFSALTAHTRQPKKYIYKYL